MHIISGTDMMLVYQINKIKKKVVKRKPHDESDVILQLAFPQM